MHKNLKEAFFAESANQYMEEIRYRNHRSFRQFSIIGTFVSVVILLFGMLLRDVVTFNTEFFVMACYFVFLFMLNQLVFKTHLLHITGLFYLFLTPIMFMAILLGTFLDISQPSITIMVFMCTLPLFILDKPWRVCLYITGTAILYTICCYLAKSHQMFVEDFIDIAAFYVLGIGVNFFILIDRLESVENYVKYREKSERDVLTGLYNRGIGIEKINRMIKQKEYGTLCILDIDKFKLINDTYGHDIGDLVLQAVSNTIKRCFIEKAVFFRMGGDEFVVYCVNEVDQKQLGRKLQRFMEEIRQLDIKGMKVIVSVSVGCCMYTKGDTSYDELLKFSDLALYEVKRNGRDQFVVKLLSSCCS